MNRRLTLYVRLYCHLCEEMLAELARLRRSQEFDLDVFDVDEDPDLLQLYGERVPVLVCEGEEVCHYHFDSDRVNAVLRAATPGD